MGVENYSVFPGSFPGRFILIPSRRGKGGRVV
jgi:hypothetical protein